MKRAGLISQIQAVIFDNLFKKIKADKHQALEIEIINSVVTKEDDIVDDFSSDAVDKVASARSSKQLFDTTLKTGRFQTTTDWLNRSDIPEGDYDVTFQNAGQNMFGYNHFKFSVRYLNLGTEYIHTIEMLDGRKFRRAYALNGYPDFEEVISSGGTGSGLPTVEASYLSDFTDIYSIGVYTIVGAIEGFYIAGFEYPNLKQMVIWSNKIFTREIDVTAEVIVFPDFVEGDKNKADYSGQDVYQNVGGIESNTPADVLLAKYAGVSTFSNFSDKAGADEDDNNIKLTYARKDEIPTAINGITPHIGGNGNWWFDTADTGVTAQGTSGITPTIGVNGNWYYGTTDTGIRAQGTNGNSVPINLCIFKSGVNGLVPMTSFSWISNLVVSQVILQDFATDISATINGTPYNKTSLIGVSLPMGIKMTGLDLVISAGQNTGSAIIIF